MEEEKPTFLTQKQAEERVNLLQQNSISYNLYLRYTKADYYTGIVEIEFSLSAAAPLILDYKGSAITSLHINGALISSFKYDGLFIHLPAESLTSGENIVEIYFKNNYANDGEGLHSFTDSDSKQYVYSECEPYYANRIFPCFDQPDLKATLVYTAIAPKDWTLLSNENFSYWVNNVTSENFQSLITSKHIDEFKPFLEDLTDLEAAQFKKTELLPTYLFGFIAGPFALIPCDTETHKSIPMSLYCRESHVEHLRNYAEFIFEVTNKAMVIYENFFETPYPFSKYDQIFCPEFNAGAMENAGLVTFNDMYVFKDEVDSSRLTSFANTITHELSHHWFGNLVTMRWWNDLWLNESFAEFISHFCLSKLKFESRPITNIWIEFNMRKAWGYREDQLSTTHPIAGEVANTERCEHIFDGITYSKGGATLKQLLSLIGEESFGKAMSKYFAAFAWKNASLNDFIHFLDEEFKKSNQGFTLEEWKEQWICTAGLNELQPVFDPSVKSGTATLKILMTPALPQHPTLRFHKIKIAFIRENGEIDIKDVILKPEHENVVEYDATRDYRAVVLNFDDETFAKLLLDDHSITFLKNNLHLLSDTLSRSLIWRSFFDMVRDGKLSSEEYIDVFVEAIGHENDDEIIKNQFAYVNNALISFTPRAYLEPLSRRLFEFTLQHLQKTPKENINRIILIRNNVISFARDIDSVRQLLQWYNGEHPLLQEFKLSLENEWSIVAKINRKKEFSLEEKVQIFQKQETIDPSDTARNMEAECEASRAPVERLHELWNIYSDPDQTAMSLRVLEYSAGGFNNSERVEELEPFYGKWWEQLDEVFKKQAKEKAKNFYYSLFPYIDDKVLLELKLVELEKKIHPESDSLRKLIEESIDDTKRRARTFETFFARAPIACN